MSEVDVLCLGEPLVALLARGEGPLRDAERLGVHVVGAELNVAVGIARLGLRGAFVGRRGEDPLGERIEHELRAEGVDTSCLARDAAPTALLLRDVRPFGMSEVVYRRTGSAGSRLDESDVVAAGALIDGATWLHVSGITVAMSESGARAATAAIAAARAGGAQVSVDVNLRERLRPLEDQRPALLELVAQADLVFCGEDEGSALLGTHEPRELARALRELGALTAVVKRGAAGALACGIDGAEVEVPARPLERIVDPVGAGDAFAAGVLAGLIASASLRDALEDGTVCAAYAMSACGDVEGLPRAEELRRARSAGEPGTLR